MEITFATKKLEKILNNHQKMVKEYGVEQAKKIQMRLNELRACPTLDDVSTFPPTRCHQLHEDRAGSYGIVVKEPYRLIIKPDMELLPMTADGGIDKSKVTCVKIMGVENYHD